MKGNMRLPLLLTLALVAGALGAMAAFTIDEPASSAVIKGNVNINISGWAVDRSIVNCTVTISSATSGSSAITVYAFNNTGEDGGSNNYTNATWNSYEAKDASDYVFAATCYNTTGATHTVTSNTAIIVDNTVPVCAFNSALTSRSSYTPTQTWTVTCSNATSATIQAGTNSVYTMTESADVCTYTYNPNSLPQATYPALTVVTSDGLNSTTCTLDYVTINMGAPLKEAAAVAASGGLKQSSSDGDNTTKGAAIAVIAVVLYFLWKKKK